MEKELRDIKFKYPFRDYQQETLTMLNRYIILYRIILYFNHFLTPFSIFSSPTIITDSFFLFLHNLLLTKKMQSIIIIYRHDENSN